MWNALFQFGALLQRPGAFFVVYGVFAVLFAWCGSSVVYQALVRYDFAL